MGQMPDRPVQLYDFSSSRRMALIRRNREELERLAREAEHAGNINAATRARREIRESRRVEKKIARRMGLDLVNGADE